jgi:CRP-like cAMP-binding protein
VRVLGDLKVGLAAIPQVLADGDAAPLVIASGLRTLVRGLWTALLVVVALRLFALGSSGVGWLNAAAGIGAAIALPITVSLIGRPRLGGPCAAAFIAAGACLIVVGAVPVAVVAAVAICVWGVAMAVADATSLSLLHRLLDPSTLSRTVGVMEALKLGAEGLGALLAPALVGLVGVRPALVIAGLPLPVTIAVSATRLRRADSAAAGRAGVVALLHRVSVLHSLDMASLEDVAARARKVAFAPGTDVVTQGEPGDDFYVIEEGEAEVLLDGYRIGRLGPGSGFGERALLRATTRSATVRTLTPLIAYAIDAVSFLSAVTGQPPSALADMREPVLGGVLEPASAIEDWEPGEVIVQEGDDATAMYVVLSGRASTTIEGRYVRDLLPGDWFGEIAILHGVPRTATISAAERLRTCRVPADVVLAVASRHDLSSS